MKCKVCGKGDPTNGFCIQHSVDDSFVERVRAAIWIINNQEVEKLNQPKTEGK